MPTPKTLLLAMAVLPFFPLPARAVPIYCDIVVNKILDQNLYVSKVFNSTDPETVNERKFTSALGNLVPGGVPASRADPASCISFDSVQEAEQAKSSEMGNWSQVNSKPAIELNWP